MAQVILLVSLGLSAVLLFLAVRVRTRRWLRWAALGLSIALPLCALLFSLSFNSISARLAQQLAAEQIRLDQHRAQWEASRPAHYVMTVRRMAYCPAKDCATLEDATVEDLFAKAQGFIRQGYPASVDYDPELGYPTLVHIDYGYSVDKWGFVTLSTDQVVMYIVTNFQILQ